MPFQSKAQQRWMFAAEPKMAKRWAKHTKDFKTLPDRVGDDTEKKGLFVMDAIAGLAKVAADQGGIEKLAQDTQVSPELIMSLAKRINLTPSQFVKAAYDDPQDYINFLKVASGAATREEMVKFATAGKLGRSILDYMKQSVKASPATGRVGKLMQNNLGPAAKTQAGRVGLGTAAAGGAGGTAALAIGGGKGAPSAAGPHETAVNAQTQNAGVGGMSAGGAAGAANPAQQGAAAAPPQNNGPAPNPPQQGGGGLSNGAKAGIAGAGVGLGALGVGAMMRKRKAKQQNKTAADVARDVIKHAILTKIASDFRKTAADQFNAYLDTLTRHMPIEKTAQVRTLQSAVAKGKPLSHAIKVAYPLLNGEQRGILAMKLVKAAADFANSKKKSQAMPFKVQNRTSATCKPGDAGKTMAKMSADKQARHTGNPLLKSLLDGTQKAVKGLGGTTTTPVPKATVMGGKRIAGPKPKPMPVQSAMEATERAGTKIGMDKSAKALIQTVMKNRGAAGLGVAGLGLAGAGAMGGAAAKTIQGKPSTPGGKPPMGTLNNALAPK